MMLKNINKFGGNAKMKICCDVGHEAWKNAYAGDELYSWFYITTKEIIKQRIKQRLIIKMKESGSE